MFLLDTNVISELRKARPHGAVLEWYGTVSREQIAIPAIVIAELQAGAERTRRQDPEKSLELELWIDQIMVTFNIVPMDGAIFREWARLMTGKSEVLSEDAMIAATARIRNLVVVTRNEKDFAHFGIHVLNPFLTNSTAFATDRVDDSQS
jgi:predicted nucleic acid-binding protein